MKIKLQNVHFIPMKLEPGILYVSKEFDIAVHLCPSGCGSKIRIPLGPTDWKLTVKNDRPSLYPSIGNWQITCQSHYWITDGEIIWAPRWTEEQIKVGRKDEEARSKVYYDNLNNKKENTFRKFFKFITKLIG